jgi:hypothetical protein
MARRGTPLQGLILVLDDSQLQDIPLSMCRWVVLILSFYPTVGGRVNGNSQSFPLNSLLSKARYADNMSW